MVIGESQAWRSRFVTFDVRLLRRISVLWPQCMAVLKDQEQAHEDTITIQLINLLNKDEVVRSNIGWIEYQFEPFSYRTTGTAYSTGRIDMAIILDRDRDRYIAYECKRLNVRRHGNTDSEAWKYVQCGLMRFITEQYAEGLPVGCMLGYVMDGDIKFAIKSINKTISNHKTKLGLISGPNTTAPVNSIKRFLTTHTRPDSGSTIEIRHALLSFPAT